MVTEIIKQNDVHPFYMHTHNWIRNGITKDALWCMLAIWDEKNKTICNPYVVRNIKFKRYTGDLAVNKW